jgi:hypothetical protein
VAVGALPDGTPVIVSGGGDGTVRVWRLADGTPLAHPLDLSELVKGIALHNDIIVTAAGRDIAVHQPVTPWPIRNSSVFSGPGWATRPSDNGRLSGTSAGNALQADDNPWHGICCYGERTSGQRYDGHSVHNDAVRSRTDPMARDIGPRRPGSGRAGALPCQDGRTLTCGPSRKPKVTDHHAGLPGDVVSGHDLQHIGSVLR